MLHKLSAHISHIFFFLHNLFYCLYITRELAISLLMIGFGFLQQEDDCCLCNFDIIANNNVLLSVQQSVSLFTLLMLFITLSTLPNF
jgi:hypothetical protein